MKEDCELAGGYQMTRNLFLALSSPETLVQNRSSFLKMQFVRVYKDILVYEDEVCLQTSGSTVYCHAN